MNLKIPHRSTLELKRTMSKISDVTLTGPKNSQEAISRHYKVKAIPESSVLALNLKKQTSQDIEVGVELVEQISDESVRKHEVYTKKTTFTTLNKFESLEKVWSPVGKALKSPIS